MVMIDDTVYVSEEYFETSVKKYFRTNFNPFIIQSQTFFFLRSLYPTISHIIFPLIVSFTMLVIYCFHLDNVLNIQNWGPFLLTF